MTPKQQTPIYSGDQPLRPRQASISSSEGSLHAISNPARHSSARSKKRRASGAISERVPVETHESAALNHSTGEVTSRHASTSSMRTSSVPMEASVTYTPTTGRISKAKKGKRVHACEFPGCGKVFTRAEHRRRHQLNHNPNHSFPCDRPGCGKAFHRLDLLQRHQERHELEGSVTNTPRPGPASTFSECGVRSPSISLPHSTPQLHPVPPRRMNDISTPGHINQCPSRAWTPTDPIMGALPNSVGAWHGYYTSSCSSGWSSDHDLSDYAPHDYHKRSSISSVDSPFLPSTTYPTPMIPVPGIAPWERLPPQLPSQLLPQQPFPPSPPYQHNSPNWTNTNGDSYVETYQQFLGLSEETMYFHPSFPIIHKPSFFTSMPTPLLSGVMVAIGSAYDGRKDAKLYSTTLLETATRLLASRERLTSKSRLADFQTVLLVEVLGRFRSRRPESQVSSRFRILYAILHSTKGILNIQDPLAVLRNKRQTGTSQNDPTVAYETWVVQETKRRILQACFVFDTTQHFLFDQPRTLTPHNLPRLDVLDLAIAPFVSCPDELWESSPVEEWVAKANAMASPATESTPAPKLVDTFQCRLMASYYVTAHSDPQNRSREEALPMLQPAENFPSDFSYHSFCMAKTTPIRQLMIVSGESWLLGRKLETEGHFDTAKKNLRDWIEKGGESSKALWHATKLLRLLVHPDDHVTGERDVISRFISTHMLHEQWTMYLAALVCWAHGFAASISVADSGGSSANSIVSEAISRASSMSSESTQHPTLLDPFEADQEMREYLHATNVEKPEHLANVDPRSLSRIHGLMETIRTQVLREDLGGLLNEAERVLYRLVEGRSRLSNF